MVLRRLVVLMPLALLPFAACVGDEPSSLGLDSGTASSSSSSSSGSSSGSSSSSSSSSGGSSSSSSGSSSGELEAGPPAPGTVDAAYTNGFHRFALAGATFALRGIAIAANGGLLVTGTAHDDGACSAFGAIGTMRLTEAGDPQLSYAGVGANCWRSGNLVEGAAITVLQNDDLVAVGTRADEDFYNPPGPADAGGGTFTMVRMSPTGQVVASIAADPSARRTNTEHVRPRAVATNGTDVSVVGFVLDPRSDPSASAGFVTRYDFAAGNYAPKWSATDADVRRFAGVGFTLGGDTLVAGIQPSNVGLNRDYFFLRRYAPESGTASGDVTLQFERPVNKSSVALTVLDANHPVVVGATNIEGGTATSAVLARASAGAIDPSFGTSGIARIGAARFESMTSARAAAIDSTGRILVLSLGADGKPILDRLSATGVPDGTFGSGGRVTLEVPDGDDVHGHVITDANDRILVVFPAPDGFFVQRLVP